MQYPCCGHWGVVAEDNMDNGMIILAVLLVLSTVGMGYILWPRRSAYNNLPRTHIRNGQARWE